MFHVPVTQDVAGLTIPFAKSGLKRTDVVENCRKKLVSALKTGTTFALYLGNASIEHADWKKKLCKKVWEPFAKWTSIDRYSSMLITVLLCGVGYISCGYIYKRRGQAAYA